MEITEEMLRMAMKKAIEHGLIPRHQSPELYMENQAALKDILKAAQQTDTSNHTNATVTVLSQLKTAPHPGSPNLPRPSHSTSVTSDNVVDLHTRRQYLA